jgi:hypothetical protein
MLPLVQWEPENLVFTWPLPDFSKIQPAIKSPGARASQEERDAYARRDTQWVKQEAMYKEKYAAAQNLLYSLVANSLSRLLLEAITLTAAGKRSVQGRDAPELLTILRRAASTGTFVAAKLSTILERARVELDSCVQGDQPVMEYAGRFTLSSQMYVSARQELRRSYPPGAEDLDDGLLGDEALVATFIRGLNIDAGTSVNVFELEAYHELQKLIRAGQGTAARRRWENNNGGALTVNRAVVFIQTQAEQNLAEPTALGRLQLEYAKIVSKGAHATTTSRGDVDDDGDDEASQVGKGRKRRRKDDGDSDEVPGGPKRDKLSICRACKQPGHFWGDAICEKGKQWIKKHALADKASAKAGAAKREKKKQKVAKASKDAARATHTKAKGKELTDKEAKALKAATAAKKAAGARKKAAAAESSDDEGTN